jgi:flavin reductase (DIM6/NTAB) family NADH-FMN oxidoreductase RutF
VLHRYDFAGRDPGTNQGLLSQLVVPRPIAMVSTRSTDGVGNLAPFSYYLPITGSPPLIGVTFGRREADGRVKDSFVNLTTSGDFVVNVCSEVFAPHLEDLAKEYPPEVDEAELHGYTLVPSAVVSSPGVAEALARLECRVHRIVPLGDPEAAVELVIGEVVCALLDDRILSRPDGVEPDLAHPRVDLLALAPIGRSGARTFLRTSADTVFHQDRTPYDPETAQVL